jgi:transcriptional regulator with XRE-family HTH domain
MDEAELRLQLGKRVKFLRRHSRLTQAQLAEKTDLSVNYISEIENGLASPTLKTLLRLAQALDVEVEELFNFDPADVSRRTKPKG